MSMTMTCDENQLKQQEQTMQRVFNFSPGPATLPLEVLQKIQAELLDYNNTGMSVMELSHRGTDFMELAEKITQNFRDLMAIPANYQILFLHGGARSQFAMAPMNFAAQNNKTAYVQTGVWGQLAVKEASRYTDVQLVADAEPNGFKTIPEQNTWGDFSDAAYLYYVDNETVNGLEFPHVPDAGDVPLICDMSSNILSRPVDVSKFGAIIACAQKNLGIAGLTIAIVRDDLLERTPMEFTPSMFNYKKHADAKSMQNTCPTFPWYVTGLIIDWVKEQGGLAKMAEINTKKANTLYDFIDQSDYYNCKIDPKYRSRMNVVFNLPSEELDVRFIKEAADAGLKSLKGHRFVGGLRASIYNAMPQAGVDALVDFMKSFK